MINFGGQFDWAKECSDETLFLAVHVRVLWLKFEAFESVDLLK